MEQIYNLMDENIQKLKALLIKPKTFTEQDKLRRFYLYKTEEGSRHPITGFKNANNDEITNNAHLREN